MWAGGGGGGGSVFINNPVHMTKMAAMPIYGKYLFRDLPTPCKLILSNDYVSLNESLEQLNILSFYQSVFLNKAISPLCLVWVRAPLWPLVRQAKFCLRVCNAVFLGVLRLSPISHMS